MRFVVSGLLAVFLVFGFTDASVRAEIYTSLDELLERHNSASCKDCHADIHQEWAASFHGRSVSHALGSLNAFIVSLGKERNAAPDKVQMLKCLDCHAPMVNEASEEVVQEIVGLIQTAVVGKDEAQKEAARKKLSNLSVNCTGCHTIKATANPMTPPDPEMLYGPDGGVAPHPVQAIPVMKSSVFCGQCHALWYADDGEFLYCTTIFESHQNAYRGMGGTQSCQDCHMKGGGHTFPGAHDQDYVKEGLELGLEALGYRHLEAGSYTPRAVVTVDVQNVAGHRIPDG